MLLAPSLQAGYNLTTALARGGVAWVNLRVTTPVQAAEELAAPHLAAAGWRRLAPDAELFLLQEILAAEGSSSPLGPTGGSGLARALQQTLHALRLAAVEPAALEQAGAGDRVRALGRVYAAYAARLQAERLWDDARLLGEGLSRVGPPGAGAAVWAILDETPLPELCFRFVAALTGARLWRVGRRAYGLPPPAQSAAARFPSARLPALPVEVPPPAAGASSSAAGVQGDLFLDRVLEAVAHGAPPPDLLRRRPGEPTGVHPAGRQLTDGLSDRDRPRLGLHRAVGAENEVRAALRQVLAGGVPLDQVEIAYTAAVPYLSLLLDAVQRFDLPATFAAGVPVGLTPPGQALAGFYRWIAADLEVAELADLCRAGLIHFGAPDRAVEPVPAHTVATRLRAGRIRRGRAAYAAALADGAARGGRASDAG
ncbi:MAG: hypothetical protein ABIL09_17400, partial [Gemmatimonadota bacterium]